MGHYDISLNDILVMVLTHPRNIEQIKAIDATWGKRIPGIYYFTQGVERVPEYIRLQQIKNIVNLNPELQEEEFFLAEKVSRVWKWAFDNFLEQKKWFICIDDDSYIFTENLVRKLSDFDYNLPYYLGELCPKPTPQHDIKYIFGGPGIVLSRECLRGLGKHIIFLLNEKKMTWVGSRGGDVFTAKLLHDIGIKPGHLDGFIQFPTEHDLLPTKGQMVSTSGLINPGHKEREFIRKAIPCSIRIFLRRIAGWLNDRLETKKAFERRIRKLLDYLSCHKDDIISLHYQNAQSMYMIEKEFARDGRS